MSQTTLTIPVVACLMLGLAPATAQAQAECTLMGGNQFGPYYRLYAQTYALGACDVVRVESRVWVDGWNNFITCTSGSYIGGGICEQITYGQSEAVAEANPQLCGGWLGKARHLVRNRNTLDMIYLQEYSGDLGGVTCRRADDPMSCESWEIWDDQLQRCIPYDSPIVVPLTRSQDYHLTDIAGGVTFDVDGNGVSERTAWTAANSRLAFLAIDMDGDGKITSGRELVGNHLVPGKEHAWEALIALAPPNTTKLNEEHELFRRLLLWEDRNHDGLSQDGELQPATNVVSEIGLGYAPYNRRDQYGNKFMFQGWASVRTAPGINPTRDHEDMAARNIKLYDVFFKRQ